MSSVAVGAKGRKKIKTLPQSSSPTMAKTQAKERAPHPSELANGAVSETPKSKKKKKSKTKAQLKQSPKSVNVDIEIPTQDDQLDRKGKRASRTKKHHQPLGTLDSEAVDNQTDSHSLDQGNMVQSLLKQGPDDDTPSRNSSHPEEPQEGEASTTLATENLQEDDSAQLQTAAAKPGTSRRRPARQPLTPDSSTHTQAMQSEPAAAIQPVQELSKRKRRRASNAKNTSKKIKSTDRVEPEDEEDTTPAAEEDVVNTVVSSDRAAELSRIFKQELMQSPTNDMTPKQTRILPPGSRSAATAQKDTQDPAPDADVPSTNQALTDEATSQTEPAEIGVIKSPETPKASGKRKRRMPLENSEPLTQSEPPQKKTRRSAAKPKTPKTDPKGKKTQMAEEANTSVEASPSASTLKKPSRKRTSRPVKAAAQKDAKGVAKYTEGRLSKEEYDTIDRELLKHREAHDLTEFEQNQKIEEEASSSEVTKELWENICLALPDRARSHLYKVVRARYNNFKRGTWDKDEEMDLQVAYDQMPKRWMDISKLLNRHPEDCRTKYRNYVVCGNDLKRGEWTEEEEELLKTVVGGCIEAIQELKAAELVTSGDSENLRKPDIVDVDWQVVSANMGHTRSRLQCLQKWKLLQAVTAEDDTVPDLEINRHSWRVRVAAGDMQKMGRRDFLQLLHGIRDSQAGREGKIPWKRLGDDKFRARWSMMARKVAWKDLRERVAGNRDMRLQDIVSVLIDKLDNIPDQPSEESKDGYDNEQDMAEAPDGKYLPEDSREQSEEAEDAEVADEGEEVEEEEGVEEVEDEYEEELPKNEESEDDINHTNEDVDPDNEEVEDVNAEEPEQQEVAQPEPTMNGKRRLRSPIKFQPHKRVTRRRSPSVTTTSAGEDSSDGDIPAVRPRKASVDLG